MPSGCHTRLLPCLLLAVFLAQSFFPAAAHSQKRIYHPIPESIPEATDPGLVIDLSDLGKWEELPPFIDTTGFETAVFGREDGEEYELLSRVTDLATDGKGTIFILDGMPWSNPSSPTKTVHVIDTQANYLGNFGRAGEGPGEFRNPEVLMVADGGDMVMVVGSRQQVMVFRRTESGAFEFDRNLRTKTGGRAGCIMRDHLYLFGYDLASGHVVHKYTMDGEYVTGFGAPYEYENPGVVEFLLSLAGISCNEPHGIVALVPSVFPVMMAYTAAGELLWVIRVKGIRTGLEITEQQGRTTFHSSDSDEKGWGSLRGFQAFDDGWFYLAVAKQLGNERRRDTIFRVDPQTGAYEHVGSGWRISIAEKDLLVGLPYEFGMEDTGAPQVIIKSRSRD